MAIKVVLVDDHAVVRQGLRALLATYPGIEVVGEAGGQEEVLKIVGEVKPEVVIMDLRLAEDDGVTVTKALRQKYPEVQVVVLSMYDDAELVFRALQAGATGYVLKRASADELVAAIRATQEHKSYLDPAIARKLVDRLQKDRVGGVDSGREQAELTEREREVLRLVAEGLTNAEIAARLSISIKTVQAHRANLMQKLGLHDRVDLVKYAIRKGFMKI